MREISPRGWHRWRNAPLKTTPVAFDRLTGLAELQPAAARNSKEVRGPDGIRHELVARIRREIAEGTYDTEEKWLLVEEALLRRIEGRA